MSALRRLWRFSLLIPIILAGLASVGGIYPFLRRPGRDRMNGVWSRLLMWLCGVRVLSSGRPILDGPVLLVSNHVSWIDIFAMNSVRAVAFIAKSDIRRWPVIGALVAGAGTLFIERGQRRAVAAVSSAMQERFTQGEAVGLFPEGTTSEGFELLPFHAGLFEPLRTAGVPIQPVALRYLRDGVHSSFASFVGEETLVYNLWRVLGCRGLSVEIEYLDPLEIDAGAPPTRVQLAQQTRTAIESALKRHGAGEVEAVAASGQ